MSHSPFIQIAGIRSLDEARLIASCGVKYLGFPLHLDVHKPDTSDDEAAAIIKALGASSIGVLITYLSRASAVRELMNRLGVSHVQLHGPVALDEVKALKTAQNFIIKSLIVSSDNVSTLQNDVKTFAPFVDAFITDTFDPKTGASGATGRTHDWTVSAKLVATSSKPVILAGGLTGANVAEAIAAVRPAGVDAHTGVENERGEKDRCKIERFVSESRRAFEIL